MMTFEELKRYEPTTELGECGDDYDVWAIMEEDKDGEYVKLSEVKQRVREAINKAYNEASCFEGGQIIGEVDYVFDNLKKRLGL